MTYLCIGVVDGLDLEVISHWKRSDVMFGILRINTVTGEVKMENDNSKKFLLGGRTLSSHLVAVTY